jgi:hypothetical protein
MTDSTDPFHQQVNQTFDWSLTDTNNNPISPAQSGSGADFTIDDTPLVACTPYTIHAKYSDCAGLQEKTFPYTKPGAACTPPPPTFPPTDAGCPATLPDDPTITRALTGTVNWGNITGTPPPPLSFNFPLANWEDLLGRIVAGQVPVPWPGVAGTEVGIRIHKTQYIGLKFHVPADVATNMTGMIVHPSYPNSVPAIAASFSTTCGNFTPPQPACLNANALPTDAPIFYWTTNPNDTNPHRCVLMPDQDYYINLKFVNPQNVNSTWCNNNACLMALWNVFGP